MIQYAIIIAKNLVFLAKNLVFHDHTKHIEVVFYLVHDDVMKKVICAPFLLLSEQLAIS